MKVKITRQTFIAGEPVKAGKTVDVTESVARNLISGGKAVPVSTADDSAPENRENDGSGDSTR